MKETTMMILNDMKASSVLSRWAAVVGVIAFALPTAIVFAAELAPSDEGPEADAPPGAYTLLGDSPEAGFPFEIFRGDIRFQCEVNGHEVFLLLDDGYMWDQLLFWGGPEVDSLGLAYDGEIALGNDDSEKLVSRTASGITVTLPGVEFTQQTAVVTPSSSGTSSMWQGSVGQISATFFKHFVVTIDFDRSIITLTKPEEFEYAGNGAAVPWEPLGFGPWSIPATLEMDDGTRITMKLLMDLGYNDQLQLVVGGQHGIMLPGKTLPASLGFNIQRHETRGYIGRLAGIEIGGHRIDNIIAGYVPPEQSDHAIYEAMVGLGLLSRFNLVFDYHRRRLFVEPNNTFHIPFEYNMSGMVLARAEGGHLTVRRIHADSPAEEAGLAVGERIVKIDGRSAGSYDFFELRALFVREGEELPLTIERNGEEKSVILRLKRVI
jgi:hypothetical protein